MSYINDPAQYMSQINDPVDRSYLRNLDTNIDRVPGMKGVRLKKKKLSIQTTDPDDFLFHFAMGAVETPTKAHAIA